MKNINIIEKLEEMKKESTNYLELHVVDYLLEYDESEEDVILTIQDTLQHGCVSGTVSHLIYTHDTHKFFDEYYNEIMELVEEYEEGIGEKLKWKNDLKNWFAWFGFEEMMRKIANELEVE